MGVLTELRGAGQQQRRRSGRRDSVAALIFLAPWLIGLVGITVGPMLASLYLAFTNYNLLQDPTFAGWDNFRRMAVDERLHQSLRVTLIYVAVAVPLQQAVALALAMWLDRGLRALALYRSIFYIPSLLGSSVAIAVLWRLVFGVDGLLNDLLGLFGIAGKGWVSSPDTALSTLMALHVWTFGSAMVIFLAGLRQIPRELHEAAVTDGAGAWQRFWMVTIPMLSPFIFFNLVLGVINALQAFTQAFVVSGGTGGPSDSTLFITLYLYQRGFANFDMGYASAIAWLLLTLIAVLTAVNFWASKYWVHYDR